MAMTRREFNRLGALGLAAGLAPRIAFPQNPAGGRKIGYAVIGLGRIAGHFMAGTHGSANSRVTALVSGHRDKAERIAAQEGVPASSIYSYENFDEIAKNPAVDAVYVALPNSMHAEYTIRAARAGKHVLCEKPMSTTVSEAEQMIAACRKAGVKLMIAYRCHYEPTNLRAVELIRSGKLGQVQGIESSFGFYCANDWRLDRRLAGGGPVFDVGIYCLNACRYLTGEEPAQIAAFASTIDKDGRFDTVEENVSWTMKFPSGIVAACSTTYGAPMDGFFRVHGSKGWLEVDNAFVYEGLRLRAELWGTGNLDELNPARDPSHFTAETEHFSRCILENREPKSPGEEGLRDMRLIDQIYRSAGIPLRA